MASYLITGCSRGIGLAMATELASMPDTQVGTIFATSRAESPAIQALVEKSAGRVVHVILDTVSQSSVDAAAKKVGEIVGEKGLDVLVNNAGLGPFIHGGIVTLENDMLMDHFKTNVLGNHIVIRAFLPLLEKGNTKKIVTISSTVGSINLAPRYSYAPCPAYKVTKAALNMLTVQYALDFADKGFTVLAISPGWLQTDMGTSHADLPVEVGVHAALEKILAAGKESNGKFLNIHVEGWEDKGNHYDGLDPPW